MRFLFSVILLVLLSAVVQPQTHAQTSSLPPCAERPTRLEVPQINQESYCLERVIDDASAGELAFTVLATAPDGTLYAARPLTGEIFRITDTNQDGLPDNPEQIASGLTLPNAMIFYEGALYIVGGSRLYRWRQSSGIEILVDDLFSGTASEVGLWTGGVAVGPDRRIYAGIGAACDDCPSTVDRGVILSFALDGSDRQIADSGFRQPVGMTLQQDILWVTDTSRDTLDSGEYDELNQVDLSHPGADYGFPFCIGLTGESDLNNSGIDCSSRVSPKFTFPTGSNPVSLAFYRSDTFPQLEDSLLVVLSGSHNNSRLRGYELGVIHLDSSGEPVSYDPILPLLDGYNLQYRQLEQLGFFPHHPYSVAVSSEGWIYVSTGGGRIYALRPL